MIESTTNFYRNIVADSGWENGQVKSFPLTCIKFGVGAGLSVVFLIHKMVLSTFFLIANMFTLPCNQELRAQEIPTYALGLLFPENPHAIRA